MTPTNILLVRLSAIGDVIHTMPVACALKDRFPTARLTWVVEDRAAAVLRGHRAIDTLIELPHGFLKSPSGVWRLSGRLRDEHFDLSIDGQGLSKSALVARLSGAPRRIGFGRPWGREVSRWLNNECVDTVRPHAVERNLELLRPLGIVDPAARFDVPEPAAAAMAAETLIGALRLRPSFAVMTAGAGWPSKRWPVERFTALALHLGQRWQLPTLAIWGNAQERAWAEEIVAGADGHGRLAPAMNLMDLAAVIRRARFFLGGDTGPLHLAAAVGTTCVGLYGPWPAAKHGPYGRQHVAVQKLHLEGSTRQRRRASPLYIEAITVDMVREACDTVMARRQPAAA